MDQANKLLSGKFHEDDEDEDDNVDTKNNQSGFIDF